jgi:hypothetical protein
VWWVGGVQFLARGPRLLLPPREEREGSRDGRRRLLQRESGREMEQDGWERASILYRPGDRVSSEREGGRGEK